MALCVRYYLDGKNYAIWRKLSQIEHMYSEKDLSPPLLHKVRRRGDFTQIQVTIASWEQHVSISYLQTVAHVQFKNYSWQYSKIQKLLSTCHHFDWSILTTQIRPKFPFCSIVYHIRHCGFLNHRNVNWNKLELLFTNHTTKLLHWHRTTFSRFRSHIFPFLFHNFHFLLYSNYPQTLE